MVGQGHPGMHDGNFRPKGPPNRPSSGIATSGEPCIPLEIQRISTRINTQSSMSPMRAEISSREGMPKVQIRLRFRGAPRNFPKSRLGDSPTTLCISEVVLFISDYALERFVGNTGNHDGPLTADIALCVSCVRACHGSACSRKYSLENPLFLDHAARTSSS